MSLRCPYAALSVAAIGRGYDKTLGELGSHGQGRRGTKRGEFVVKPEQTAGLGPNRVRRPPKTRPSVFYLSAPLGPPLPAANCSAIIGWAPPWPAPIVRRAQRGGSPRINREHRM